MQSTILKAEELLSLFRADLVGFEEFADEIHKEGTLLYGTRLELDAPQSS